MCKKFYFFRFAAILFVAFGLCALNTNAQTVVTVTYANNIDNPTNQNNIGDGNPAANDKNANAFIPVFATNIVGTVWGGGGAGGGSERGAAGGGGAGGYATYNFGTTGQGETATVLVGKCGMRQGIGENGLAGGNSKLVLSGYTLQGNGGNPGTRGSTGWGTGTGGAGGTASAPSGGTATKGGDGANGNIVALVTFYGGKGGDAAAGGAGGQQVVGTGNGRGYNADNPGGGGGGGTYHTGGQEAGGYGGGGRVVISFTFNPTAPVITGTNTYCEGETLTLSTNHCVDDHSSLIWYKNGVQVGTGATLTINNVALSDAGNYTCKFEYDYSFPDATSVTNSSVLTSDITSLIYPVTIYAKPVVSQQNPPAVCRGDNINFTPNVSLTYSYSGSGGYVNSIVITNVTSPQTLSVTPKNANNCVGEPFNVNITVKEPTDTIINATICQGDFYTYSTTGAKYYTAGEHILLTTKNAVNCDSVVKLNLTINPKPVVSQQNIPAVCRGGNIDFTPDESLTYAYSGSGGYVNSIIITNVTSSQTLSVTPKNANNCVGEPFNVNITVKEPTEEIINASICQGGLYTCLETGNTYSTEGVHTLFTTTNAAGCDSVVKLNLTINPKPVVSQQNIPAVCRGGNIDFTPDESLTYSYNGSGVYVNSIVITNVTSPQTLSVTPKNANNCVGEPFNVIITVKEPTEGIINASICQGGLYTCLETGNTYSTEGVHTLFTTTNAAGCDSVVKLNLTFKESINTVTINNKSFNTCSGVGFEVDLSENLLPEGTTFTWIVADREELSQSNPQTNINLSVTNESSNVQFVIFNVKATDICGNVAEFDVDVTVKPKPQPISNFSAVRGNGYLELSWNEDENAVGYILTVFETENEAALLLDEMFITELPYIIDGNFDFTVIPYTFKIVTDYGCAQSEEYIQSIYENELFDNKPFVDMENLTVWTNNGELYIKTDKNRDVTIYTAVGVKVTTLHISTGKISKITLPKGIYILQSNSKTIKAIIN